MLNLKEIDNLNTLLEESRIYWGEYILGQNPDSGELYEEAYEIGIDVADFSFIISTKSSYGMRTLERAAIKQGAHRAHTSPKNWEK